MWKPDLDVKLIRHGHSDIALQPPTGTACPDVCLLVKPHQACRITLACSADSALLSAVVPAQYEVMQTPHRQAAAAFEGSNNFMHFSNAEGELMGRARNPVKVITCCHIHPEPWGFCFKVLR